VSRHGGEQSLLTRTRLVPPVSRIARFVEQAGDPYSLGKNILKRAQRSSLVKSNITGNKLPPNSNGIHFVLAAKDVNVGKF
jgi:hypothetical protein